MIPIFIIASIILCILLIIIFLVAPSTPSKEQKKLFSGTCFAHRGLHTKDKSIPENSLPAFQRAVEAGYGIELDIQFSKDEQLVVFHDDTLNRVCGIDGRVDSYNYEELQSFRLCETEERIPLFSEVLSLVDGKVPLMVELKNGPKNLLLCEKSYALLQKYTGLFCMESFQPGIVSWYRKHAPQILRGQLSAPAKEFNKELPPSAAWVLSNVLTNFYARPNFLSYHKEKRSLTAKLCDRLGALRAVWTVRDTDKLEEILSKNDIIIFEFINPVMTNSRHDG